MCTATPVAVVCRQPHAQLNVGDRGLSRTVTARMATEELNADRTGREPAGSHVSSCDCFLAAAVEINAVHPISFEGAMIGPRSKLTAVPKSAMWHVVRG
jgi:hypothetical protein